MEYKRSLLKDWNWESSRRKPNVETYSFIVLLLEICVHLNKLFWKRLRRRRRWKSLDMFGKGNDLVVKLSVKIRSCESQGTSSLFHERINNDGLTKLCSVAIPKSQNQ
jgi:hypothetical protein